MQKNLRMMLLAVLVIALSGLAQADGHGRGRHDRDDDDRGGHYYSDHDRNEMRDWYHAHDRGDRLPPGLREARPASRWLGKAVAGPRHFATRSAEKMMPCPEEIERRLPPPPRNCAHVVIGGHVVLVNRSTNVVLDIFHFEMLGARRTVKARPFRRSSFFHVLCREPLQA